MKESFPDIILRFAAAVSDTLLLFIIIVSLNSFFLFGIPEINPFLLAGISLAGLLSAAFIQKILRGKNSGTAFVVLGLLISLCSVLYYRLPVFESLAAAAVFLSVWALAMKKWNTAIDWLYSKNQFLIKNAAIILSLLISDGKTDLSMPAILYASIGILLLMGVKRSAAGRSDARTYRLAIDAALTAIIAAAAFTASRPDVTAKLVISAKEFYLAVSNLIFTFLHPVFALITRLFQGINLYASPRGHGIQALEGSDYRNSGGTLLPGGEQASNPVFAQIALLLLMIALIAAIALFMLKAAGRRGDCKKIPNYTESREFNLKPGTIPSAAANAVRQLYKSVSLLGTRKTPKEKLRREYAAFIHRLNRYGICDTVRLTPFQLTAVFSGKYPVLAEDFYSILHIYEEVRYGLKDPEPREIDEFKKTIRKIQTGMEF